MNQSDPALHPHRVMTRRSLLRTPKLSTNLISSATNRWFPSQHVFIALPFRLSEVDDTSVEQRTVPVDEDHTQRSAAKESCPSPSQPAGTDSIDDPSLRIVIKFLNDTQRIISAHSNDTISKIKQSVPRTSSFLLKPESLDICLDPISPMNLPIINWFDLSIRVENCKIQKRCGCVIFVTRRSFIVKLVLDGMNPRIDDRTADTVMGILMLLIPPI